MASQLPALRIDSLRLAGEPVSPYTTAILQIPREQMGKPIHMELEYHFDGEPSGTLKLRITGSHLEPTHAVTESPSTPVQRNGTAEISFTPNAYGLTTLFFFVDDQPLHISMFRLTETDAGALRIVSGPDRPVEFEELPLPEDVEIS
ncbi:MAG: hypothetical protein GEU75_17595 [Dehalococcoidia bacterium]|nr:hypothetical protein [Dehalococcoidia bacterium]